MRKLLFLIGFVIFTSCSPEEEKISGLKEFITVNGDTRNLETLNSVEVERYEADLFPQELQLSLELTDSNKSLIGDLGGFNNERIRLWVTIYTDNDLENNMTSFSTLHDDSINGSVPVGADKINLFINLLTDEGGERVYGSAENGQTVKASIKDGFLIVEWQDINFVKSYEYSELEFTSSGSLRGRIVRDER